MRTRFFLIVLISVALVFGGATGALAQHEGHGTPKPPTKNSPKNAAASKKKTTASRKPQRKRTTSRSSQASKSAPRTDGAEAAHQQGAHQHGSMSQQEHSSMGLQKQGSTGMTKMTADSRHALATAHAQSIGTFAKTLRDQVQSTQTVNAVSALAIVDEMRRNLDAIEQHHREHGASMPASSQSEMGAMMRQMQTRIAAIKQSLSALEQHLRSEAPAASTVFERAGELIRLTGEMSMNHSGHEDHKM